MPSGDHAGNESKGCVICKAERHDATRRIIVAIESAFALDHVGRYRKNFAVAVALAREGKSGPIKRINGVEIRARVGGDSSLIAPVSINHVDVAVAVLVARKRDLSCRRATTRDGGPLLERW